MKIKVFFYEASYQATGPFSGATDRLHFVQAKRRRYQFIENF